MKTHIKEFLPSSIGICENDTVILNLPDVWPIPCVQWQVLKSSKPSGSMGVQKTSGSKCKWEDLFNQNNNCLIFKAKLSDHLNKYRAIIRDNCECIVTNSTKLTVNFINLVSNPTSICFDEDGIATFTSEAEGRPKPDIQWQVSTNEGDTWTNIPDENSNTLTFVMTAGQGGNLYRAVFKNKCGLVSSQPAQLLPETSLIIDNGIQDNNYGGLVQQFLWLNRFTPIGYPFILEEIQVFFSSSGFNEVMVGDPIDLYIWENPTGNSNPAIGGIFRGSLTGQQIQALNTFNSYILPDPISFNGPGDILIGVVNRLPLDNPRYSFYFPITFSTSFQMRSWVGRSYPGDIAPNPPPLPAPTWVNPNFGDFMIRGIGCGATNSSLDAQNSDQLNSQVNLLTLSLDEDIMKVIQ